MVILKKTFFDKVGHEVSLVMRFFLSISDISSSQTSVGPVATFGSGQEQDRLAKKVFPIYIYNF